MSNPLAKTPEPPYYAVIFSNLRSGADADGYSAMADEMERLAAEQPGFLGVESVRGADGVGVTVSYWRDLESIQQWRDDPRHGEAQHAGRAKWYERYVLRVCRVEKQTTFPE